MKREASAVWMGGLKDGQGTVSTRSGALAGVRYTFHDRFEQGAGTNPEELIAAAHAGCFSMALSGRLGDANLKPEIIRTQATLTLEKLEEGWSVTGIHLDVTAKVPGAERAAFEKAAELAKNTCPISRLLKATTITLAARLEA